MPRPEAALCDVWRACPMLLSNRVAPHRAEWLQHQPRLSKLAGLSFIVRSNRGKMIRFEPTSKTTVKINVAAHRVFGSAIFYSEGFSAQAAAFPREANPYVILYREMRQRLGSPVGTALPLERTRPANIKADEQQLTGGSAATCRAAPQNCGPRRSAADRSPHATPATADRRPVGSLAPRTLLATEAISICQISISTKEKWRRTQPGHQGLAYSDQRRRCGEIMAFPAAELRRPG